MFIGSFLKVLSQRILVGMIGRLGVAVASVGGRWPGSFLFRSHEASQPSLASPESLSGTTCLTLLVYYGLICFLRHYLSNTAN